MLFAGKDCRGSFAVNFDVDRVATLAEVSDKVVLLVALVGVRLGRTVTGAASALAGHVFFQTGVLRAQSAVLQILAGLLHHLVMLAGFMDPRVVRVR